MSNTGPRYIDLYDMKTGLKRDLNDFIARMRENPFSSEYSDETLNEIWELADIYPDICPDRKGEIKYD